MATISSKQTQGWRNFQNLDNKGIIVLRPAIRSESLEEKSGVRMRMLATVILGEGLQKKEKKIPSGTTY